MPVSTYEVPAGTEHDEVGSGHGAISAAVGGMPSPTIGAGVGRVRRPPTRIGAPRARLAQAAGEWRAGLVRTPATNFSKSAAYWSWERWLARSAPAAPKDWRRAGSAA